MKKVLFSFAILAAVATMTSCENKGNKNADSKDSTAVEATEAAAAEAEDPNTLSTDAFSMKAPEGWVVDGKIDYLKQNNKICFRKDDRKPAYKIEINWDKTVTFDTRKKDIEKLKAIDPIKVGSVEFQGGWQPDGKSIVLYANLGDKGTARVFFPKPSNGSIKSADYNPDDAAVLAKLAEVLGGLNIK